MSLAVRPILIRRSAATVRPQNWPRHSGASRRRPVLNIAERGTRPFRAALLILLFCILPGRSFAAKLTLHADTLEQQLMEDAEDGHLDRFDLVSAALIASGIDDTRQLQKYAARLVDVVNRLKTDAAQPVRDRARSCLLLLHDKILTGQYHVEYTQLARVLDEGHYNCVTATILYCFLCKEIGLKPIIMATRDHVFVRFESGEGYDVETTCPDWFDFPHNAPIAEARKRQVAIRRINQAQLMGKVYYNLAVQQLEEKRYSKAVFLLQQSLRLDAADVPARENLLAAINNWSLAETQNERYRQAAELLAWGRELDASYGPFQVNDLHIHQRWVLALCQQGCFSKAIELLEAGYQRRPDAPLFDEGRLAVYRLWSEHLLATGPAGTDELPAQPAHRLPAGNQGAD